MLLGGEHLGNLEPAKRFGRILDTLDLVTDRGQAIGDFLKRRLGFEMILQPSDGEFHDRAPTPADRVG